MKKYDLEHIIQTKLENGKTPPPPSSWDAIQKGRPSTKPWYLNNSFWVTSTLVTALTISSIMWLTQKEPKVLPEEPVIETPVVDSILIEKTDEEIFEQPIEPEIVNESEPIIPEKTVVTTPKQIEKNDVPSLTNNDTTALVEDRSEPKKPKIIRIIETDTVVTQKHIYR